MGNRQSTMMVDPTYMAGALALQLAVAAILIALGFEHLGGYAPCPLCLMQRYAYYAGIPALFVALILFSAGYRGLAAALLALAAFGFFANAGLGIYHSGVEWKFWPGPTTCSATGLTPLKPGSGGLLGQLETTRVVPCDSASWRFLGLSFAGWNAVSSLLIFFAALRGAASAWKR